MYAWHTVLNWIKYYDMLLGTRVPGGAERLPMTCPACVAYSSCRCCKLNGLCMYYSLNLEPSILVQRTSTCKALNPGLPTNGKPSIGGKLRAVVSTPTIAVHQ